MRLNFLCGVQTSESLLSSYSNWSHHGSPCNRSRISEVKQELSSRIPYKCIKGRQHSPARIATERYKQCDLKATWRARGQEECLSPLRSSSPDRTGAKWKDGANVGILWFFNLKHHTYFPSEDGSWRDYFQGIYWPWKLPHEQFLSLSCALVFPTLSWIIHVPKVSQTTWACPVPLWLPLSVIASLLCDPGSSGLK